jgi:hypothetical protein
MTISRRIILLLVIPIGCCVICTIVTWRHSDAITQQEAAFKKHTVPRLSTITHLVQDLSIINLSQQRSLALSNGDERASAQRDFTVASKEALRPLSDYAAGQLDSRRRLAHGKFRAYREELIRQTAKIFALGSAGEQAEALILYGNYFVGLNSKINASVDIGLEFNNPVAWGLI